MVSEMANRSVASAPGTDRASSAETDGTSQGDEDWNPETNKRRSRSLAKLRHDLRGPINHIIGYSEMLEEEAQDRDKTGFIPGLQKVRTTGVQLLALVDEYLGAGEVGFDRARLSQMRQKTRTPLDAIIGYSEVMEEEAKDQSQ